METVRWGIVGCGNVTEVKSGPALQKARGSELVAVMRRHGDLARDYAQRHNVARWYDDAADLIGDPEVNAVYVATPPSTHLEYAIMAARAGKPVYVEKPMARTHAECVEMIAACEAAGVPLYVAYYRRMLPRFRKVVALLHDGAIGDVRTVNVRLYQRPPREGYDRQNLPWRLIPEIAGAGLFLDLASHTLDLLDLALGPIAEVAGFASNQAAMYEAEDVVSGAFRFASGVHGVGTWCFGAYRGEDVVEITGSAGRLTFSTFGVEPVLLETDQGSEAFAIDTPAHVQQPLIQTVVDALLGRGSCPSTGESAARTNWVMDEMLRSYRGGTG
ncbi:MAG: Gfo/Idh/MocA family oxidoreductase [Anaerolineae bacterium]|nr:Gfo/Idh/MocA family oxidoreductase [Anaerolineae bacterium]